MDIIKKVQNSLFEMQDISYRDFHAKLIPNVDKELIIGVRTPQLRKFAKEFSKTDDAMEFIKMLPHKYYEENNLHGFILETIKDYDTCIKEVENFLPYVDNWATCDLMSPVVFKKHPDVLLLHIDKWLNSKDTYTIRFGIEMLMKYYLGENYKTDYSDMVARVRSNEYYVNMMIAWYFATALAKNYEDIIPYIEEGRLEQWTQNKAIQKAIESRRITDEQKIYLRTLKLK